MHRGGIVAALAVATGLSVHGGAQIVSSTVAIDGRVLAASTGDPLPNVRVTLNPATADTPIVVTDTNGRFTISTPAGRQRLVFSKAGYARTETATTTDAPLTIRLHAAAAISGRITDDAGEPSIGARVVAANADSRSDTIGAVLEAAATDDRGEYRLGDLPAGAFVVAVVRPAPLVVNGQPQGPDIRYFPGTTLRAEADPVTVEEGGEATGIDIMSPAPPGTIPGTNVVRVMGLSAPAPNDPDQTGRGSVAGRIVTVDGRAVPRAAVILTRIGGRSASRPVRTDEQGAYRFANLDSGHFVLTALKPGYLGVAAGPTQSVDFGEGSQREVTLEDDGSQEDVDISMTRSAAVSGRVLDERSEPVERVTVQLLQPRYERGRHRLMPAGFPQRTDDRGAFRVYGVRPGRYVVSALAGDAGSGQLPGYARSWYPGAGDAAQAQVIDLASGEDLSGIDISLARERTFSISGTLIDSSGEPTTGGTLQLLPSARSASVVGAPLGARISDGRFVFANIPPGAYVIRADRGRRSASVEGEFGTAPVTVTDRDVTGVVLQTSAGSSIGGRITFDSAADKEKPQSSSIEISPIPVDFDDAPGTPATADIREDWTFQMRGINGVRRLSLRRVPPGWALEEIRVDGVDATDRPLAFGRAGQSMSDVEIVLTDRVPALKGSAADSRGNPVSNAHVVVFSTDRDRWYPASRFLRIVQTGKDGTFTLAALAAGSYYAAAMSAIPDDGEDAWQDPGYLESLIADATSVVIADGDSRSVTLRVH